MWSPILAVAGLAVHVVIRTVASDDRVQRLGAVMALVALAMPFTTLGQDHFGSEDYTTAAWATVSGQSLDGRRIGGRWLRCEFTIHVAAVGLQGSTALTVAVAFGTELLAVANSAVDFTIRTLAAVYRVEALLAFAALEASLMVGSSTCQHLLGHVNESTTTRATFSFGCFCYRFRLNVPVSSFGLELGTGVHR